MTRIEPPEVLGDHGLRVEDRGDEEPGLEDREVRLTDVDEAGRESEDDEPDAERERHRERERNRQKCPRGVKALAGHEKDERERDEAQEDVHEADADRRGHERGAGHEGALADVAGLERHVRGVARRLREERPEQRAGQEVGGEVGDLLLADDDGEDERHRDHLQEGVQQRPGDAEGRALVPDLDVAGDQLRDEVPEAPEVEGLRDRAPAGLGGIVDGPLAGGGSRGALVFPRRAHEEISLSAAVRRHAPVIAAAEVLLQPDVQDDEQVAARPSP